MIYMYQEFLEQVIQYTSISHIKINGNFFGRTFANVKYKDLQGLVNYLFELYVRHNLKLECKCSFRITFNIINTKMFCSLTYRQILLKYLFIIKITYLFY